MDLIGAKILVLILLAVIKLTFGLSPIFLAKWLGLKKKANRINRFMDKFMGITLCFGGGVLLATVFIHMIPEVRESLDHASSLGYMPDSHYPFSELLICLGFFLIYAIEAFVHKIFHAGGHGHSHGIPAHFVNGDQHEMRNGVGNKINRGGVENNGFVISDETDNSKAK